jgi:hypothetical protein
MGNNTSNAMMWSEEPAKPTGPLCGHRQPVWPYKACTRRRGHEGDHCEEKRAGSVMIDTWWEREDGGQPSVVSGQQSEVHK